MLKLFFVSSFFLAGANALIVPGELPTILSLVYSNIPTIKKGTDSRLGWGFRLGNRADFQVLVELGPQTYTRPLGNEQRNTNSKRNTVDTLSNVLYAQRQREKNRFSNTDGGKWLKEWSHYISGVPQVKKAKPQTNDIQAANEITKVEESEPVLGIGEVDAKLVIPEDSDLKVENFTKTVIKDVTSRKGGLDDVELDE